MEIIKDKGKCTIEFEDFFEVVNYLKDNPYYGCNKGSGADGEKGNFCSYDYKEAVEMLQKGWPEGSKKISGINAEIESSMSENAQWSIEYDVQGDYIDIGKFLSGEPECIAYTVPIEGPKKEANIMVTVSYPWIIEQESVYRRGAAITALIDNLLKDHHVNVQLISRVTEPSPKIKELEIIFNLSTENDYSKDLLAFYLACSAFLRRIILAIEEKITEGTVTMGYGRSIEPIPDNDNVIVFKQCHVRDWQTTEQAAQNVKNVITQYNLKQKERE